MVYEFHFNKRKEKRKEKKSMWYATQKTCIQNKLTNRWKSGKRLALKYFYFNKKGTPESNSTKY